MEKIDASALAKNWPAPFVTRDQKTLDKFSGGILKAQTLANHDSLGTGPEGRIRVGRRIAYPTSSLVQWVQNRIVTSSPIEEVGQ